MATNDDLPLFVPVSCLSDYMQCTICMSELTSAVLTPCGHRFCDKCISEWLSRNHRCPSCNKTVTKKDLIKDHQFDSLAASIKTEKDKSEKEYFEKLIHEEERSNSSAGETRTSDKDLTSADNGTGVDKKVHKEPEKTEDCQHKKKRDLTTCDHEALEEAIEFVQKAVKKDKERCYEEALKLYEAAINCFENVVKYGSLSDKSKELVIKKNTTYVERADKIRRHLEKKEEDNLDQQLENATLTFYHKFSCAWHCAYASNESHQPVGFSEDWRICYNFILSGMSFQMKMMNMMLTEKKWKSYCGIVVEKPNIKWDEVAGLEEAKSALQECVLLPAKFPHLFTGRRRPHLGILLYGPPGTGKSYLAKALATEADTVTFFSVSAANLCSRLYGGDKILQTLFSVAKENKNSIIFFDELDDFGGSWSENDSETQRKLRHKFFIQQYAAGTDKNSTVVIGASNRPWALDLALRRRFSKRIYIPLPDVNARSLMFRMHLGNTFNSLIEEDFRTLGEKSEGYSGADISLVVRDALMKPIKKVQEATHFKKVRGPDIDNPEVIVDDLFTPCSPNDPGAIEMTVTDIPEKKLLEPAVEMGDMLMSLQIQKATVKEQDMAKFQEFKDEYG